MSAETFSVGDTQTYIDEINGKSETWTVDSIEGGLVSQSNEDGCSWTSSGDPMEPSSEWSNCNSGDWSTGGTKSATGAGKLWPLQVGNKVTFSQIYYNSTGFTASGHARKKCKVTSAETLDISGTAIDAFKVECSQDYGDKLKRTYWFSPEHGLVRYDTGKGSKATKRLVRTL